MDFFCSKFEFELVILKYGKIYILLIFYYWPFIFWNISPQKKLENFMFWFWPYISTTTTITLTWIASWDETSSKAMKKKFAFQNWPQMWNKRATPIYASRLWYYHPSPKHNVIQYEGKLHCKHSVWIKNKFLKKYCTKKTCESSFVVFFLHNE